MPTVSVVIPTYNCERYIAQTIGCILRQTHQDTEIIVVDDGSTDATPEIVSAYGSRVRLISQINSGVSTARNRGLQACTGEYICFMDHDDYWYADKLARQLSAFASDPTLGIVFSTFILWHQNPDTLDFPSPDTFDLSGFGDGSDPEYSGWIYHQLLLDCWVLTSTAMIRTDFLKACGGFDESLPYSEDWDLWLRLSHEHPFLKLNRPTTLYRQHAHQGNRTLRDTDYRTLLLETAARKWGLCSQDGRCVSTRDFHRQLSVYHGEFALHHLAAGHVGTACKSFFSAWRARPQNLKLPAYILAAILGYRPRW